MKWTPRQYLIAFNMVPGIGGRRLLALEQHFGSLELAWKASAEELMRVSGFGSKLANSFLEVRSSISPRTEEEWAKQRGAAIVTLRDEQYPNSLRALAVPPPVLYVLGKLPAETGVAVVGTRKPSRIGIAQTREFSGYLVRSGRIIVSGLARGVDFHAHNQAIQMDGRTVAVVGSNLGNLYPAEHRTLVQKIITKGAVVSEFSSRCPTVPGNFPRRNRIIAALSEGVLIVQAGVKSGAIITCDWALELGLDVWAIPGEISDPLRAGCHNLIKQGAYLVTQPQDLFGEKISTLMEYPRSLKQLYKEGYPANEIAATLGMPIQEVLATISFLQIGGER